MDAVHFGGLLEYNAHNLYGILESVATCSVRLTLPLSSLSCSLARKPIVTPFLLYSDFQ